MAIGEFHGNHCDVKFALMFSFREYQNNLKLLRYPNCNSTGGVRRIPVFMISNPFHSPP